MRKRTLLVLLMALTLVLTACGDAAPSRHHSGHATSASLMFCVFSGQRSGARLKASAGGFCRLWTGCSRPVSDPGKEDGQ